MKIGMAGASMMMTPWMDGIKSAAELGYNAFEIFGEFPQIEIGRVPKDQRNQGRKLAEQLELALAVHAPFNDLNIASLNRGILAESVRQMIEAVKFCRDLAGKAVVIHNGEYIIDQAIGDAFNQAKMIQWQLNLDSLKRICEQAEKSGVLVCLENCNFVGNKIERSLDDLLILQKEVNSPNLKFALDIGHSRLAEGVETAIKKLGPEIRHIHFTDNLGKNDDHLIIGEGDFDYSPFLDFIRNFPAIITLEVVKVGISPEPAQKSLANFRKIMGIDQACIKNV